MDSFKARGKAGYTPAKLCRALVGAALGAALIVGMPALAQSDRAAVNVPIGDSQLLRVGGDIGTVFVADPQIADIQVPGPGSVLVLGRRSGATSLYVLDGEGNRLLERRIVVRHNVGELQDILRQRFPALRLSLESAPGSIMVSGTVPDAETAEAIARTVQPYIGETEQLINRVTINSPTQVYLQVRVTEVSRSVTQQLGVNWQALTTPGRFTAGLISGRDFLIPGEGGASQYVLPTEGYSFIGGYSKNGNSVQALIDVLDREGLVSVLAEPNLTAVSGQTASFLAGGEFPVPVRQEDDQLTVEFKPFGVALDFTPTVLADDRISIKVRPEISELDPNNSIVMDGLAIPGLSVRRVETTVEMASGQSFAIGGLLQNNVRDVLSKVPGLGSVPVLGKLFSSTDYQNHKSELVVIVTPYLVRPTGPNQLTTPLASMRANSDIEYILQDRIGFDALSGDTPRLTGSAGYVY